MKTFGKFIFIISCILSMACVTFGCDGRSEEKIGYFKGTSFVMGNAEYMVVEEKEDLIYIKDKCLGVSEDGGKYVYSVKHDENKEFILIGDRGIIPGEDYELYSSVELSMNASDDPTAVYLSDKYNVVFAMLDGELEKCLYTLESEESTTSSYKYSEFADSEIRIYFCFEGRAVGTVKKGVLLKTGAGWVYTPSEFFEEEKNGIVKGKIISDKDTVSYFENIMK